MKDKKIAGLGLAMLVSACATTTTGVVPAHNFGVGVCGNKSDNGTLQWTETVSRDKSKYSLELCFESKGSCNSLAEAYEVFNSVSKSRQRDGYRLAEEMETKSTFFDNSNGDEWAVCKEYDFVKQ